MLLLAVRGESAAAARVLAMTVSMNCKQLQALREKHGLTQVQIAQLLHLTITVSPTGKQSSSQVGKWERGEKSIPPATAELLRAKLLLLGMGEVTFDDLIKHSLDGLIADIYS